MGQASEVQASGSIDIIPAGFNFSGILTDLAVSILILSTIVVTQAGIFLKQVVFPGCAGKNDVFSVYPRLSAIECYSDRIG